MSEDNPSDVAAVAALIEEIEPAIQEDLLSGSEDLAELDLYAEGTTVVLEITFLNNK